MPIPSVSKCFTGDNSSPPLTHCDSFVHAGAHTESQYSTIQKFWITGKDAVDQNQWKGRKLFTVQHRKGKGSPILNVSVVCMQSTHRWLLSVRPTVTFPAAEHHRPFGQ